MIDDRADKLASALRSLIRALDGLDDEQIRKAVASLTSNKPARDRTKKAVVKTLRSKPDASLLDELADALRSASSREQGYDILKRGDLTKRELALLARRTSVHVVKEDTIGAIEEKLIETLVGSRLNSLAIQTPRSR